MATIGRKGDFGYLNDNLLRLQKEKDWNKIIRRLH